jgi:DNA-binding transcriptional LysR family regulator
MELKWLEDLLVLLEEKSVTRAAARRHVTQPAFSRRIRQLEGWLGVEIVDRSTKPVSFRQTGLALEEGVRDIVSRLYALRNSVHESQDQITFVAQHTLAISRFPSLIRRVKISLPEPSYRVVTANYEQCESLFYNEADLLLCYQSAQRQFNFSHKAVRKLYLGKDRLIPVASRQLASQLGELSPRMAIPILMYQQGSFLSEALVGSCLPEVIRDYRVEVVCESAFSASLKAMVLADMGIAWLAGEIIEKELSEGAIVSLGSLLGETELDIVLYYRDEALPAQVGQIIAEFQEPALYP